PLILLQNEVLRRAVKDVWSTRGDGSSVAGRVESALVVNGPEARRVAAGRKVTGRPAVLRSCQAHDALGPRSSPGQNGRTITVDVRERLRRLNLPASTRPA